MVLTLIRINKVNRLMATLESIVANKAKLLIELFPSQQQSLDNCRIVIPASLGVKIVIGHELEAFHLGFAGAGARPRERVRPCM